MWAYPERSTNHRRYDTGIVIYVVVVFFCGKKRRRKLLFFFFPSLASQTVCETNLQVARECGCDSEVHLVLSPGAGKHQPRGSCDNHYPYSRLQVCLQVSQVASASPNPRGRVWPRDTRLQVSWVVVV